MTKKNRTKVDLGRFKGFARYDGKSLKKLYDDWKSKTSAISGTSIGFYRYSGSLYDYILGHGVSGRVMGNSGPKGVSEERKFKNVIDAVEALANNKAFDVESIREIISVYNTLTRLNRDNESDENPRNIAFEDPIRFNKKTFKIRETKTVYGHYITPNYIEHRRAKARKIEKITVPSKVDSSFYNYEKGEAKPPYWQYTLGPKGLRVVLREALKTMKEMELDITTPIPVGKKRGAGEYSYRNFAEFNGFFKRIFSKKNIKNYITPQGNISTDKIQRMLRKIKINPKNNAENGEVKSWMDAKGLPGTIESFYIDISRRQINNIAQKYFKENFEAALEAREKKAREKKDESTFNKSWRELLAW